MVLDWDEEQNDVATYNVYFVIIFLFGNVDDSICWPFAIMALPWRQTKYWAQQDCWECDY